MKVWNEFGVLSKCAVCSHEVGLDGIITFHDTPWFILLTYPVVLWMKNVGVH